ncbi:MAG: hypothetical protein C0593_11840, partial [Marinilabiliales bacterium]
MRTIFISTLFILFCNIALSQSGFEIVFEDPQNQTCWDIHKSHYDYFYGVGYIGEKYQDSTHKGLIYKISRTGDTTTRTYHCGDTIMRFVKMIEYDDHFIVAGTSGFPPDFNDNLLIAKIDTGLNMHWFKQYPFEGYTGVGDIEILKTKEGTFFVGTITDRLWGIYGHMFAYRFDDSFDTIRTKVIDYLGNGQGVSKIVFSPDSSEIWTIGHGIHSPDGSRVILDTLFNVISTQDLLESLSPNMNIKWHTDSTLLLAGNYRHIGSSPQDNDIGITKTDTSFSELNFQYLGAPDTIDYPAWNNTIDFIYEDTIYYAGTHNVIFDFWPQGRSWIVVGQLDKDLQLRKERYYGGDAYYTTLDISCTNDGGCIVSALKYDYLTQDPEYDVVILKLSREDFLSNVGESNYTLLSESIIYPNPGADQLNIETKSADAL